jgi:OHCU decarboxylase
MSKKEKEEFLKKYAGIYEHSPWVAEAAFASGHTGSAEAICDGMKAAVMSASHAKKLELICAHPELACTETMTQESVAEQAGAGLNHCSREEFAEFKKLNAAYKKKFGFPFIIAVKGLTRQDILHSFRNRMQDSPAAEFENALEQIHRIARFRLMALFHKP